MLLNIFERGLIIIRNKMAYVIRVQLTMMSYYTQ